MTQAELAGGTIDAPQASPEKGQLIRDFTLTSTLGQEISLSDYRGHSNLVLVFAGGSVDNPDLKVLAEIAADHNRQCTLERAAQISQVANLPFPLLVDEHGQIHRSAGAADKSAHPVIAIYITDRFGEVFAVYRAAQGETMPSAQEIIKWLTFINIQCPECGHPEWPT